jgi:transposase InsO family protein
MSQVSVPAAKPGITRPDHVWSADITYVPLRSGYLYLTAILDWYSRYVLAWRLSGDLVCVDIDNTHALTLADNLLPQTSMIEGRPGKPSSHRWYRVSE